MTLETILNAAVSSMITGHHSPHCYSAHVIGKGYVNDGNAHLFDRADYLRQLERSVRSEIDNMRFAPGYAERGYDVPTKGVLFADWNKFPRDFDKVLERAGYAVEWSDEWSQCDDCQRAFRTSADSYCWTPEGVYIEEQDRRDWDNHYRLDGSAEMCLDCLQDWAVGCRESELDDAYERALPIR